MKLREKMKRFWTLDVHNHEGFTLVELIIVIAILAILSTGAIAGYSAYVERANKTADKAMVSEIVNILTLKHYSDGLGAGYIIITDAGITSSSGVDVEAALVEAYGSGWKSALKLKYNGWTDDGLSAIVDGYTEEQLNTIANSTFLTTATPDGLMNAVTNLTGIASGVIQDYANKGNNVSDKLSSLLGEEFAATLDGTGVTSDSDDYETVISNMLVGHFADAMSKVDLESGEELDPLTNMTLAYATLYAYAEANNNTEMMSTINANLAAADSIDDLTADNLVAGLDETLIADYVKYNTEGAGVGDGAAVLDIMGAVSHIAGTYTDAESLSNPNLYASDSVSQQLNNYINAVKAAATLGSTDLPEGAVGIYVADDGSISVLPAAVYSAA